MTARLIEPQLHAHRFAVALAQDVVAYRVARENAAVVPEKVRALGEADHHHVGEERRDLVHQPGHDVLLVDDEWGAQDRLQQKRREADRRTDVAARGDHQIGTKFEQCDGGLDRADEISPRRGDELPRRASCDRSGRDESKRDAVTRNDLLFRAAARTDVEHLADADLLGEDRVNREDRVDMPARASAREQQANVLFRSSRHLVGSGGEFVATDLPQGGRERAGNADLGGARNAERGMRNGTETEMENVE